MWTSTGTILQGLRGPSPTAQDPWVNLLQQGGLIHWVSCNTRLEFTTRRLVKQPVYLDSKLSVTELYPGPAPLSYATITSSSTVQPQGQPWGWIQAAGLFLSREVARSVTPGVPLTRLNSSWRMLPRTAQQLFLESPWWWSQANQWLSLAHGLGSPRGGWEALKWRENKDVNRGGGSRRHGG